MSDSLYIKNITELRFFLDLAGYGCYSRKQMKKRLKKPGTYDKRLDFLNTCLDQTYWHYTQQGKERRFSFHGNIYETTGNYLTPVFFMKTLDMQWLLCYILILQVLDMGHIALSYTDLQEKVMTRLYIAFTPVAAKIPFLHQNDWKKQFRRSHWNKHPEALIALKLHHENWESQIRRRLQDLVDAGLVIHRQDDKERYSLPVIPFSTLSRTDWEQLHQAMLLYSQTALLTLPGCTALEVLFSGLTHRSVYQVRNTNPLRICDDTELYKILKSMQHHKTIRFQYKSSIHQGISMAVQRDTYQREYVYLKECHGINTYNIQYMYKTETGKSVGTQSLHSRRKQRHHSIELILHYKTETEHQELLSRIQDIQLEYKENKITANSSHCYLIVQDGLSLIPWLRTLQPAVEIGWDSTGKLRQRMITDLQEALENYD